MNYPCPTCGYPLDAPPEDSEICPSCGTQFGYSDSGRTYAQLRENWIRRGAPWHSRVHSAPPTWNPYLQLIRAGYRYAVPFQVKISLQEPIGVEQFTYLAPLTYLGQDPNEIPRVVYVR
jgi:hypothetical protein